ncbi:MAG: hypothetical protein HC802_21615 [Caldilineaceae bacterium]|nr:hypothetical protein [Caldilineaceae bacterium]
MRNALKQFASTPHIGVTPTGYAMGEFMSWQYLGKMTDEEMSAIWLYLQSLPSLESTAP